MVRFGEGAALRRAWPLVLVAPVLLTLLLVALVVGLAVLTVRPAPAAADPRPTRSPDGPSWPPVATGTPSMSPSPSASASASPSASASASPIRSFPGTPTPVRQPGYRPREAPSPDAVGAVTDTPSATPAAGTTNREPDRASYVHQDIARGLIVGGLVGFVLSTVAMVMVGLVRRRF